LGSTDLLGAGEFTTFQNYAGAQIINTTKLETIESSSFIGLRTKRALGVGIEAKIGVEYNFQPQLTGYEKKEKDALENNQSQ
jgi:hypothetical protein